MNRPKKSKVQNPTLPENQADLVDERNLIDTKDSTEISIEDRISVYWMENKTFVSACIFALALSIIGFNGIRIYISYEESKIQAAYTEAVSKDTLSDFAQAYSGEYLGGLAALKIGDQAYVEKNYEKALNFYTIAGQALVNNILEGRARLGEAFSMYYSEKKSEALVLLAAMTEDDRLAEVARIEAAYHLAVQAQAVGNKEEFERFIAQIKASKVADPWIQRVSMLEQQSF